MNIKDRNWNQFLIFIIFIIFCIIQKSTQTSLDNCSCDVKFFDTSPVYCLDSGSLSSVTGAYSSLADCTSAATPSYSPVSSIDGVGDGEWVFFDENGHILSATSTSNPVSQAYKYSTTTLTAISPSPTSDTYYLNKYGGGSRVILLASGEADFTIVPNAAANQAYPSEGAVIYCTGLNTCELITDLQGLIYVNANDFQSVIIYDSSNVFAIENDIVTYPYFVYEMGDDDGLIDCSSSKCITRKVIPNDFNDVSGIYASEGYYLGGGYNSSNSIELKLIHCTSDYGCEEEKMTTIPDLAYFVNAGGNKNTLPLIKCDKNGATTLKGVVGISGTFYINGDTTDNSKPLIYCESDTSCKAVEADESLYYLSNTHNIIWYDNSNGEGWKDDNVISANMGYFINGRKNDNTNKPLIYCSAVDSCDETTANTGGYYIFSNTNYLISCSTTSSCILSSEEADEGYYINSQNIDKATFPLISCSETSCISYKPRDNGYFLDQSSYFNNKYYGLIYCVSITSCNVTDIIPGFYINMGSEDSEVIECKNTCLSKPANSCVSTAEKVTIPSGTYCFEDNVFSFVFKSFELNTTRTELDESEASNYLASVSSDDPIQADYIYSMVGADIFPGITSSIETLFKVSKNSITQVIEDGIVPINKKNNSRLLNFSGNVSINTSIILYKCESSTSKCTPVKTCSSQIYIYDSGSGKGLYCSGSTLTSIMEAGFYLDGSRIINNKTPYVLKCDSSGNCTSLSPKNVYLINSGYDSSTKKLIRCDSGTCMTTEATIGYYLGYDQKSIIQCTSPTKCVQQNVNVFRYFLNNGAINSSKLLIQCNSGKCSLINPNSGYYLTHSTSILINCISRTQCTEVSVTDGYYTSGYKGTTTTKYIIHCSNINENVKCSLESTSVGAYVTNDSNILVNCDENDCTTIIAKNGIFRSATSFTSSSRTKRYESNEKELINSEDNMSYIDNHLQKRDKVYNLISCDDENCRELSPSELATIPICSFNSNKCYITYEYSITSQATTNLSAGGYCTNRDRSKLYFATDSIVVESNIISGTTSTFVHTTTNTNCIEVSKAYKSYYYTVGSTIYRLDDNRITQVVDKGYYFINVIDNTLATGHTIDEYNNSYVKIYKCNGIACTIIDNLKTISYFADVNKKIIKYDPELQKYSFAYNKDIICIYENNQCTPKYDLEKREFCITYLGELALTSKDIKSRESGDCFKSESTDHNIYGFSQYLYKMDQFSAIMVDNTAYYLVTKSTNSTAEVKDYYKKPKSIVIYGCIKKNCNIYNAKEKVYYYDNTSKSMYRLVDGVWEAPSKGGYAYISISPNENFIYKFSIKQNEVIIEQKVSNGFFHTVDGEMFECSNDDCKTITDSGYVFTNNGEIYYCEYDSEELEETVCKLQSCVIGEYYYIDNYYYRCDSGSVLNLISSKNCVQSTKYIINFPTILSDDYPSKVRTAVDKIARNNNSTATVKKGHNYLPVVPAVYTNCTYNFEDKEATFDLLCVKNYVILNHENEPEICSIYL
ncbi:scaffoldin [Anaeromyces robustus]|uniref:Scaffoldin n=1 Tax=Anaeromyces robustus TaxID=1754192 RepID=A0A1Y1WUX9_9FUNG|nr:scaffoldin [Anaeromyces robustus]|eukprot:ORX77215.1 scaffoldin [Anaeromyces robustus]